MPGAVKPVLCAYNQRVRAVTELKLKTNPCPCGSGLRAVRCCELDMAALPVQDHAALLDTQANEAAKLFNERKYAEAEALVQKLLDVLSQHSLHLPELAEPVRAFKRWVKQQMEYT